MPAAQLLAVSARQISRAPAYWSKATSETDQARGNLKVDLSGFVGDLPARRGLSALGEDVIQSLCDFLVHNAQHLLKNQAFWKEELLKTKGKVAKRPRHSDAGSYQGVK